jgi:hypothetical protein
MKKRYIVVAGLAALTLEAGAYADDATKGQTSTSGATSDTTSAQQGSTGQAQQQEAGKQRDDPGMLPDHVEDDTNTKPDASRQPTEAERQAGGAIGNQPGKLQSVVGTVAKVEQGTLTVQAGSGGDEHELTLDATTRIMKEGREISRDQITEGDEVRASFMRDSMTATEIQVMGVGTGSPQPQGSKPGSMPEPQGTETTSPAPTETEREPSGSSAEERR